jgi:hypothetical protein
MFCTVDEAGRADARGAHDEMRGHREVTVEAIADGDLIVAGFGDHGESPRRHVAPGVRRRKELPVIRRVACHGIGDVVGSQTEALHGEQDLAVRAAHRLFPEPGGAQGLAVDPQLRCRRHAIVPSILEPVIRLAA